MKAWPPKGIIFWNLRKLKGIFQEAIFQEATDFVVGFELHIIFVLDRLTFPKVSSLVKNGQKSTEWKYLSSQGTGTACKEIACSKLTIETLEQGVNVQSYQ